MTTHEMRDGCLVYGQAPSRKPDDGKQRIREVRPGYFEFDCPGCGKGHTYRSTESGAASCWTFNGSLSFPTFSPSMRVQWPEFCCHFFVTDGKIAFESDCTHEFAGKTLDLPEIAPLG